jgi:hypothetical protein
MLVEPVHSIQLQQTHFVSYGNFPKAWFPFGLPIFLGIFSKYKGTNII